MSGEWLAGSRLCEESRWLQMMKDITRFHFPHHQLKGTSMSIIVKDAQKIFTPAPEGLHQAVCADVVDLGLLPTPWGDKQKVEIRWQLDVSNPEHDGMPFLVVQRYTLSLNEKATLRHHLEAWRGRKFSAEELAGFDLEKLIEVNCQLQIIHNLTDQGRTFANVQACVPLGKGMAKMRVSEGYVRQKDRNIQITEREATRDEVPF